MTITLHGHSRATMSFNQARNSANVSYPCLRASCQRLCHGTVSTTCRTATRGSRPSTQRAARAAIRRPPHDGQNPRPLHDNGTRRWWWQVSQTNQPKPPRGSPQVVYRRSSSMTYRGRDRSPLSTAACNGPRPSATSRWRRSLEVLQQSSVAPMACCDCTHQAKIWTHAEFRSCQPWGAFEVGRSIEEGRERCQVFVQVSNKHVGRSG